MSLSAPLLRPMSAGDLLDQAIRIYRRNWITAVGVVALVQVPLLALQTLGLFLLAPITDPEVLGRSTISNPGPLLLGGGLYIAALLAGAIGLVVQMGALAVVVSESYLGKAVTIGRAYGRALKRALPLLGVALSLGILDIGLVVVALIPFFGLLLGGSAPNSSGLVLLLLPITCGAFGIAVLLLAVLNTFFILSPQAIVLENLGVIRGMSRSWNLVRGSFWRVLGILFILILFIYLLVTVPTSLLSLSTFLVRSVVLGQVIQTVASGLLAVLITPIQYAVLTLLYYDLRIRKEGFDLELSAQQLSQDLATSAGQAAPS